MDRGEFHDGDHGAYLDTLERWDRIFAVLENDDHAKLVKFGFVREGAAGGEGGSGIKTSDGPAGTRANSGDRAAATALVAESLGDDEIEKLIADRVAARRSGNYARSDEIRASLLKAGVILEDTKAGTRWKRR